MIAYCKKKKQTKKKKKKKKKKKTTMVYQKGNKNYGVSKGLRISFFKSGVLKKQTRGPMVL